MTGHGVLVTSSVTFVLPYKVGSDVNDSHHDQKSKDIQSMYPVWVISKFYKIIEVVCGFKSSGCKNQTYGGHQNESAGFENETNIYKEFTI